MRSARRRHQEVHGTLDVGKRDADEFDPVVASRIGFEQCDIGWRGLESDHPGAGRCKAQRERRESDVGTDVEQQPIPDVCLDESVQRRKLCSECLDRIEIGICVRAGNRHRTTA